MENPKANGLDSSGKTPELGDLNNTQQKPDSTPVSMEDPVKNGVDSGGKTPGLGEINHTQQTTDTGGKTPGLGEINHSQQTTDTGGKTSDLAEYHHTQHKPDTTTAPVVFRRRWFMLALFCFYSLTNAFQWIHLNIIANLIVKYYNESLPASEYEANSAVDWLSMVYMLAYVPLIFPATWLLDKKGLRFCCIGGSFLNALGAWLKCASVAQDRFGVLMFAQTVCAVAQVWVLGIPARFAAVWFGPNEVSTATSLGVFGNQLGGALGFLIPPILVPNSDDMDEMTDGYYKMFFGTAAVTTLIFVLVVI